MFLLFFGENLILGVVTLIRLLTLPKPNLGLAGFFCLHYGFFTMVHGFFTIRTVSGLDPVFDFWWLGLPMIMIGIRYAIELLSGWFLGGGRSSGVPTQRVMLSPYPRVMVLHLAVITGAQLDGSGSGMLSRIIADVGRRLDQLGLDLGPGATLVVLLMVIKTVVDVATTRRQLRAEAAAPAPNPLPTV